MTTLPAVDTTIPVPVDLSTPKPLHIEQWIPTTVKVFYNETDIELELRVKRLTSGERDEFEIWQQLDAFPPSERQLLPKAGEESLPQTTVMGRRIAEMTDEDRKAFADLLSSERAARSAYYRTTFEKYLKVVPGQLTTQDASDSTVDVTSGAQFFDAFEHSEANMVKAIHAIHYTSVASPAAKNKLRLLADSASTSQPQQKEATGRAPEKTAGDAALNGSAPSGTAPAPQATTSSSTPAS